MKWIRCPPIFAAIRPRTDGSARSRADHSFTDHYLDVEYDLSKSCSSCTANVLHTIPQPLQDRMEILRLPGYTEQEKLEIAKRFLVKRSREATGLTEGNLQLHPGRPAAHHPALHA